MIGGMRPLPTTLVLSLLAGGLAAQGQIATGQNLVLNMQPAGDVDDDGFGDLVFEWAGAWTVRSGRLGTTFSRLIRPRLGVQDSFGGLRADLDADGCDDLFHCMRSTGRIEFLSGRDGRVLFAFGSPYVLSVAGAADIDGDGADDVLVFYGDALPDRAHYDLLSGRGGSLLGTFQVGNSACCNNRMMFVGDVDGDGFADLMTTTYSYAQTFYVVLAGPDLQRQITGGSGGAQPGHDTNGDGRDELLVLGDYVDAVTNQIVWPGPFWAALPMDLDGDGAMDVFTNGAAWSGRTQTAFAGTFPQWPFWGLGDIDGDGRDEAMENGMVYELVGAPPASIVRDRGGSGATAQGSRPRIRSRLRPRPGGSMRVDLQGGPAGQFAFLALGTAQDQDLGPLGAPSNRAYVAPLASLGHVTDGRGFARQVLAVPPNPALLGAAVTLQWAVVAPQANALGLVTSNALDLVVGA